jgi:uncharacterized protein (DUF433 family)
MSEPIVVQVVYENGVLKPTQPLSLAEQQVVQISLNPEATTDHPHITKTPGVCGGRPVVRGTRIPVKVLVGYYRMNDKVTDIMTGFPNLTAAQLYDALSYYYDHQAEIDADMEADELSELLKQFNLQMNADGVLSPKS